MNEEALQQLYTLAQGEGYSKSFDDFKVLMSSNEDALNNMYTVSQSEGYKKSIDDFKVLVGFGAQPETAVKKKEDTESVSADGLSESPKIPDYSSVPYHPFSDEASRERAMQDKEEGVEFSESPKFLEYQIDELEEKLGETLKKDISATPKKREVKYDRFGDVIYDSAISDEIERTVTQMSNAIDAEPIREEIKDLRQKLDGTKAGFRVQPSFQEVYQEAFDPETNTLDKQKLREMGVEIPLLFNDNSYLLDLMGQTKLSSSARTLYNEIVENHYDSKKEAAGYVYVNGEYVDPESPMPGYGFDAAMDTFKNFSYIVSKEEEEAVNKLNNMFNQYGFKFYQSGGGDNLTAVGPDGKQLKFFGKDWLSLDNWTSATDKKYGAELKRVMANAYEAAEFTDEEMFKQAMIKPSDPKAIKNEDVLGIATRASSWSKQATSRINNDAKKLKDLLVLNNSQEILIDDARKEADKIKQRDFKDGLWASGESEAEYNKLIKESNDIVEVYKATYNAALKIDANRRSDVSQITRYEGDRAMMMADMWDLNNVPALIAQSIGEGAGATLSGYYGIADFAFSNMINLATGYDETAAGYQTDEMQRERKASVSKQLRGGLSSLFTLDMLPGVDGKTSAETIAGIHKQSFLLGSVLGVAQSLPAMFSGAPVPSFAAMHIDGMANEMNNIPEFKNISENEKMLILAPIATVAGVLENFGFRNAMNSSSLVGRLTVGALKKFGAQTAKEGTKRTFKEIVERSVMNKFAKGGILLASSGLAEAETGAAQELTETWMKEIYDLAKGQDFYKQSIDISKGDFMNMEFTKEIAKAAAAEAIGGLILGAPSAYSGAVKNNSIVEISDAAFNLFTMTTTPESVERTLAVQRSAYNAMVGVETNPETGQKFTQKEVDDTLLQYEYLLGQKNEINPNWDAKSQKQVLALLMEKKNLEQSIEGLDKNTTKDQQREIEILKEDIEVISSAANKNYEQVLKKEYEKAKEEGFTGTIEAFKFRESVEKAAKEKQAPVKEEVVEETTVTEEVTEEAPVTEEERTAMREALETQPITKITTELVAKEKKGELTQEETDGVLLGIMEKIEAENAKRKSPLSPEQAQKKLGKMQQRVFEGNKQRYLELSGVMPAAQEQVVEKAPVKEAPKRKRRRKVAPVVKEEVKVSEEVTAPIAKPKVVVSGTADGYQVVSSSNTTQAENESVKDARGDKTFDKDGFRITKLKDGSSQVSYKSKVKVSDKGNRPGYAMATVTIPKGSPINKQQIQEAFDNKLSEIIESNRKKKLGSKFSDLTAKQSQQLTDAVVNALSQEQVVEEAIKTKTKEAPKRKTRRKKPVVKETPVKEVPKRKTRKKKPVVKETPVKEEPKKKSFSEKFNDKLSEIENADGKLVALNNRTATRKRIVKRGVGRFASSETVYDVFIYPEGSSLEDITTLGKVRQQSKREYTNYEQYKKALKRQLQKETSVFKQAPTKEAPKKEAPVKEEPQVSEEVQKEIDRAERLRDRIVADKTNRLSRTKGFEQKEEIRDEIRQAEKKYNNIITELKEGKRTRFRLSDDATVETEEGFITEDAIVEVMKGLGSAEANFKIPVGEKQTQVDPIALSKSLKKITDAQAKKLGFKSVDDMLKNIEEFNGIPMVVAMSDVLAAGTVKDSMGNDMQVDGGLLYNVLGRNKTLAWAGVNETGATVQFEEAKAMYRANKELFDRLWKEGKLPKNHVPMVVLRMGVPAINSNEAVFRFLSPKAKSYPKANQKAAFEALMKSIEAKKNVSQKSKTGKDTVKSAQELESIIKKNKIKDIGSLFDFIVKDAKKRAKGDAKTTIALNTRALLFDMMVSPEGVGKASKPPAKALIKGTDSNGSEFLSDTILSEIAEPSMLQAESGDAVAIMGVDVSKNGGVTKAKHNNYGFGPKGRLIALIRNPMNGLDIFPEWRAKAARIFKKDARGEMPTSEKVSRQTAGAFFGDKAMRGARVQTQPSDIDIIAGKMRFAFPSVSVSQTQQEFDEVLKQEGIRTSEANGNTILGLTKDGKIFLNPSKESLSTPIHEFGHIWIDYLRSEESGSKGSKLLEKGLELVEGTKALESAIKKYGDNALAREEALVELMGTKGETIANAAKKAKFVEWFNAFFKYIKEKLTRFADIKAKDIKDITLEEFVDIGLAELFSGEAVDAKFKPEEAAESAKARMQKSNIKPSMSAQNIINKARAAEIRDAVIVDYLMSEKKLTRKQAVSAIKRANRGNLKDAVKRLFNNVEDITDIKEKDAQLIKDILKFDRSITRADKMAQKKAKEEIKSRLKAIQRKSKGKLSQSQLLAVTNRFANVNLSSEKSIDSFVDYMQKVFSDVDYAAKMTSLNKSIKQAKGNINSKIGRGADGLAYELKRLLNISPTIIPDSVLEEYSDLVTSFGERKTVLNLKDSAEVKETIAKIFEELSVQNSELGELSERFEAFEDKEFTKTGGVSFAKTVAQMLKDKVITEDEAKLMRKFKSEIMPIEKAEGKTEEEKQKEMEEEKEILIKNIKKSSVNVDRIELAIEKALVKGFARLIKTDAVNDLNNAQLKNIEKAIDNINNGYVTHYVQLASENLVSINRSKTGAEGIKDAKPLAVSTQIAKIKTLYQKGSDANKFYKLIERNPLINIDMVLGDFTSKRIFNSVLEESAEAVTTFNTELNKVYNTIEDAEVLLQKKFKYNGNKILESKYKQMAYMVQQEFESNPNNSQVNPAAEVIEATIKKLRDSNQSYEADILQGILEDYSTDGQIDLKKLDDSFVYAELNMIKTVQDINSKLTDKATYTASVIRGESIEPLNDYIHQSVLNTDGVAVDDSRALSENYMENIKPSTKAKNLIERTKGAKAINFDITASVRRGAKMTLMDYHLTAPLRTANRTLNKIEKQLDAAGQERQIFLAVRDAYNQAIADILENTFTSSSIGEQVFQYAAKQGYRSMLASLPRVFVELVSNYAFALNNPTEFAEGSKPKNMKVAFSDRGVEVMNNVNSKQTARMYGEELSGRFVESSMINKKMGMAADSAKNPVVNRLNQGLSYLKKYPRGVEVVADFMITTPDKLVTRPMWFGSFATEFKKITGQEVDFNKIAENDAEYMEKFEEAINEAKRKADDNTVLIGATDNPLMGILKNKKRASDKGVSSLLKTINTFMQRFLLFEYNAFRKGMYAAMGRGDISRGRGARLMLAVSARMTIYTTLMPILASLIFGDDDDDEDESTYTRVYRGIVSTMTNLFIGRDFGAIVKMIQNGFIEWANKEYGRDLGLREGKYDPFKNQVQFNIIPPEKSYKETDIASDILPNMLGPYTPLVKSLIFSGNKLFFSKPKKEEDARERQRREKEERIPLELLGLTGLVPFYKDIRKKLNEDIYKGLRKKDSDEGEEEESSSKPRKRTRRKRRKRTRRKRTR